MPLETRNETGRLIQIEILDLILGSAEERRKLDRGIAAELMLEGQVEIIRCRRRDGVVGRGESERLEPVGAVQQRRSILLQHVVLLVRAVRSLGKAAVARPHHRRRS